MGSTFTPRRILYGLASIAVVALRLTACEHLVPPRPVVVARVEAGAPVAVADAGTVVRAHRHDKAVLLANGHVLMPTKDVVHDWDPFGTPAFRSASLGDAGPEHTFSFVPLGGRRFLVAKSSPAMEDENRFELWDAERLVRLTELGVYVADTAEAAFSPDGSRALLLGCKDRNGFRTCEVGVHDLATGELVHRTRIPPARLPGDVWRTEAKLGPGGRYFVLAAADAAIEVYDSATGQLRYRGEPSATQIWDRWYDPFAFLDEQHLLAIASDGRSHTHRIVDLATGKVTRITGPVSTRASALKPWISPDRRYVATLYSRPDGRSVVLVWNLVDRSTREHVIPADVCAERCDLRWAGPGTIVVTENTEEGTVQLTVDAVTGTAVMEPFRIPGPFEVFAARPVEGDFEKYGTRRWHPGNDALVSPRGARFELGQLDLGALTSAVGDRFLLNGLDYLRVLTADGRTSQILPALPP